MYLLFRGGVSLNIWHLLKLLRSWALYHVLAHSFWREKHRQEGHWVEWVICMYLFLKFMWPHTFPVLAMQEPPRHVCLQFPVTGQSGVFLRVDPASPMFSVQWGLLTLVLSYNTPGFVAPLLMICHHREGGTSVVKRPVVGEVTQSDNFSRREGPTLYLFQVPISYFYVAVTTAHHRSYLRDERLSFGWWGQRISVCHGGEGMEVAACDRVCSRYRRLGSREWG